MEDLIGFITKTLANYDRCELARKNTHKLYVLMPSLRSIGKVIGVAGMSNSVVCGYAGANNSKVGIGFSGEVSQTAGALI